MTKIAIVGSSRLDNHEAFLAKEYIIKILDNTQPDDVIITGDAKGVDGLVRTLAYNHHGLIVVEADVKEWMPMRGVGFRQRNMTIAQKADIVYSIATKTIKDESSRS